MDKDIVSTKEEDKPLIYISEEAINLKRDNDKYKNEIERLNKENNILKKNAEHNDKVVDNVNWKNMFLKKIIEQAIDYIEKRKNLNWYAEGVFVYELLNILQGDDKE